MTFVPPLLVRAWLSCGMLMLAASGVYPPARHVAAQSAPAAGKLSVPYTQFALPNGLQVILHEDHTVPVVSLNVRYRVGSASEKPGRTGFAHLFEHLMFEGSAHVKDGEFDTLLENVGGSNNGSTTNDYTSYWIDVPSNALELALFLESDRMGYLLESMTPELVNGQREVVMNERRQSYENRPYGMASIELDQMLFPPAHPYHWPVIGHKEDLEAATYQDVVAFFRKYYAPNNASLVVAGDIEPAAARRLVEKWFSDVKPGPLVEPIAPPAAFLTGIKQKTIVDRVQLPRLYLAWLTAAEFAPADAALVVLGSILSEGKNSRLYRRLVYDRQIAQDVWAYQNSAPLISSFQIVVTPRPGHGLDVVQAIVDEEIERLKQAPPEEHEIERAVNQIEASFYDRMDRLGSYRGKANQLNAYYAATGDPDFFAEDFARFKALAPSDVQAAAQRFLPAGRRVELRVVPAATR